MLVFHKQIQISYVRQKHDTKNNCLNSLNSRTLTLDLSLSLSFETHILSHTRSLSLSISFSLTHTHQHTHAFFVHVKFSPAKLLRKPHLRTPGITPSRKKALRQQQVLQNVCFVRGLNSTLQRLLYKSKFW